MPQNYVPIFIFALVAFLVPAFIGNSIGGVVFVALLNHAQVKEEI